MDLCLIREFRRVNDDIILIHDVYNYLSKKRFKRNYYQSFRDALKLIALEESNPSRTNMESINSENNHFWLYKVLKSGFFAFSFIRDVVISMIIEELCQYPVWSQRVSSIILGKRSGFFSVPDIPELLKMDLASILSLNIQIKQSLRGCIPFLVALNVYNIDIIVQDLVNFLSAYRILSSDSKSSQVQSYTVIGAQESITTSGKSSISSAITVKYKSSTVSIEKSNDNLNENLNENSWDKFQTWLSPPSIRDMFKKIGTVAITHPLISLSLRMLADPELHEMNSFQAISAIVTHPSGIFSLFRGYRSALVFSIIPIAPIFLLGIPETLLYRLIATNQSSSTLPLILISTLRIAGLRGLLAYGFSAYASIPSQFASYCISRWLTSLIFGTSHYRQLQIQSRNQILDKYFDSME